jgi:Protein of unknown function, DUF481
MKPSFIPAAAALIIATLAIVAVSARADTVTLKDGSVIHGKILKIDGGTIALSTGFAGDLAIKQDQVASFETDEPVFVKTKDNSTVLGKVGQKESELTVASASGSYTTKVDGVKSSWRQGAEDPEVVALRRHWAVEISTDIAGKSGNSTGISEALGAVAILKTPTDALKFYAAANHSVANHQTSQDTYKGGVEYNAFFSPVLSWYVSSELMQDNVKDIALRVSTLGGLGWNAMRTAKEDLQFRLGLSYRYETYNTIPSTPNYASAGLNLAMVHRVDIPSVGVMNNAIGFVPSFKDTSNFVLDHDSNLTMPFGGSKVWSLRFGVTNEYTSKPVGLAKKLDTTYYARLVLDIL